MKVHVLPEIRVIPGGHSLGVKLRPNGVIVVGFASVIDKNGINTNQLRIREYKSEILLLRLTIRKSIKLKSYLK